MSIRHECSRFHKLALSTRPFCNAATLSRMRNRIRANAWSEIDEGYGRIMRYFEGTTTSFAATLLTHLRGWAVVCGASLELD